MSEPRISNDVLPRSSLTIVGVPTGGRESLRTSTPSRRASRWSDGIEIEDDDILEIHGPSLVESVTDRVERSNERKKKPVPPPLPR